MKTIHLVDLSAQYADIKPDIDAAITNVVNATAFILGKEVALFEEEFSAYSDAKYCVGLDNGSSALELGLRALGIGKGDEVITPVNSFIASSSAISFIDATPVWVDCDPKTYTIDVSKIKQAITKKTKAIMPVHLYGQAADMDAILQVAKQHKLFVIEDACQAHGARYKGKRVGSFGDFAAFSFYPGKNLGAYGDAGALVTNNKQLYRKVKMMRSYGQSKKYHHEFLAWNRRLDTLQAGILRVKLRHLDAWNKKRQALAHSYSQLLADLPVVLPYEESYSDHVYHLYVIQTKKRDKLKSFLESKGIEVGIHYPIPIHKQRAYKTAKKSPQSFPASEHIAKKLLTLPLYPELSESDVRYITNQIKKFFHEKA